MFRTQPPLTSHVDEFAECNLISFSLACPLNRVRATKRSKPRKRKRERERERKKKGKERNKETLQKEQRDRHKERGSPLSKTLSPGEKQPRRLHVEEKINVYKVASPKDKD